MEGKTLIEATWRKGFKQLVLRFVSRFFSDRIKTFVVYLVCMSLLWISREDKTIVNRPRNARDSTAEVFLGIGILQGNFIEITLQRWCPPVNLLSK